MSETTHNVIIIGSGPAGYTAAIYAARAEMQPIVITGMQPGGQLTTTTDVENFPGYPEGIMGPALMTDLQKQAERFGTRVVFDFVSEVKLSQEKGGIHQVITSGGEVYNTKTVIISTGASAKYLGLDDEKKYAGSGVSACATCDGFFYKGKEVAVVGGGDTAAEEAIYLANLCSKVYLLVRKSEMRASKVMQDRVLSNPKIEVLFNHELEGLSGNLVVEKAHIFNNQTQEKRDLAVDGVFIAIGHNPNTELFKGVVDIDESGYIITQGKGTHTNVPGVFAAGDVQDSIYRQAISAAGSGCKAAIDAERYISEL
uniref:thioredoxin-disulfide reductase n=1 Tax=Ornithobacterium rhinotracheale TaxID=28251 RepID=UPI0039A71D82